MLQKLLTDEVAKEAPPSEKNRTEANPPKLKLRSIALGMVGHAIRRWGACNREFPQHRVECQRDAKQRAELMIVVP